MKIFILGSTGMIGHKIFYYLTKTDKYEIFNISKSILNKDTIQADLRDLDNIDKLIKRYQPDLIINSAGLLIEDSRNDRLSALKVNSLLPCYLDKFSDKYNYRLIHLSTDCVFSGLNGPYKDSDNADALSCYGRTKALGEVSGSLTIRTSVIGPDLSKDGTELLNWFMQQDNSINGYKKSLWSGITTLELAKAIETLIPSNIVGIKNISSNTTISKYDLLKIINDISGKGLIIKPVDGPKHNKALIRSDDFIHTNNLSYVELVKDMFDDIKSSNLYSHY